MRYFNYKSLSLIVLLFTFSANAANNNGLNKFPKKSNPVIIGNILTNRFLEQPHSQYGSPLRINEPRTQITYPDVCVWLGGFWFAKETCNEQLFDKLKARFEPLFSSESYLQPKADHVDNNVFGALPLELYLETKEKRYLDMGMNYALKQWELPEKYTAEEKNWLNNGYSWQTRIWLDDMFMITTIQAQAYRVTNESKYIDRAAREMVMYLDSIQLDNGLFYHSPTAPFCWGRGNGWMAVGMTEILRILPENHPQRARIMTAYLKMMQTLKMYQSKNGLWRQLVDDSTMWDETSGSAMFTYAMIVGVKKGWLNKKEYTKTARNGWIGLVKHINKDGDVTDVCEGTNIGTTSEHYRNRLALTGDLHGQAPVLWCAFALSAKNL